MQGDSISEWTLIAVAGVSAVVFVALAAYYVFKPYFYEPRHDDATKPDDAIKPNDAIQDQKGWIKTGRVDFVDPESIGNFILRVEETRIVDGIGSVVHREIRWRKAVLEEADDVLVAYHAERKLVMAPNYTVTSSNAMRRGSQVRIEQTSRKLRSRRTKAPDTQPEEYAKPDDGANDVLRKAPHLLNPV